MRLVPWSLCLLVAVACAGAPDARPSDDDGPRSQAPEGFWERWGDGKAELNGYALRQPRYGELRAGEAVLVFVTETMTQAQRVKSDGGHPDEYPVLKLNDSRQFQTGFYDYRAMTSAWVRLDGRGPLGSPEKVSTSVQEWCGHAWLQLLVDPRRTRLSLHSYFDGEGDRQREEAAPAGGLYADALPMLVRGLAGELLRPGARRTVPYLGTLLDARLSRQGPAWGRATISRSEQAAPAPAPEGEAPAWSWTVEVDGGPTTTWWVEEAAPHRLLGWRRSDGEEARLLGTTRSAYWTQSREGDEALRAALGLPLHRWAGALEPAPTEDPGAAPDP